MGWFRARRDAEPGPQPPLASPDARAPELDPADKPDALRVELAKLVALINANSGQIPGVCVVAARRLTDTLSEIIDTSELRPLDIYTLLSLRGTIDDYLPTSLNSYLAISPDLRDTPRPSGRTPSGALSEQLADLHRSARAVLTAVRDQDADALMTQGNFLRTKFSASDLDLR